MASKSRGKRDDRLGKALSPLVVRAARIHGRSGKHWKPILDDRFELHVNEAVSTDKLGEHGVAGKICSQVHVVQVGCD